MRALIIFATLFSLTLALSPNRALQGVLSSKPIEHCGSSTSDRASHAIDSFDPVPIPPSSIIGPPKNPDNVINFQLKLDQDTTLKDFDNACSLFCSGKGLIVTFTQCLLPMSAVGFSRCEAYFIWKSVSLNLWTCFVLDAPLDGTDFLNDSDADFAHAYK
jgi:hypothetical protein